jgi:hypothetical protein
MLATVQFDHQPGAPADEIANERANGYLPAELVSAEAPFPELEPEQSLLIGGIVPEFLRPFRRPAR